MPRSSTRHTREVQGIDVDLKQAADFGEYNDYTAKDTSPQSGDSVNTGIGPATPAPQAAGVQTTKRKTTRRRKKPAVESNGDC